MESLTTTGATLPAAARPVELRVNGTTGALSEAWSAASGDVGKAAWPLQAKGETLEVIASVTPAGGAAVAGKLVLHHANVSPSTPGPSGAVDDPLGTSSEATISIPAGGAAQDVTLSFTGHSIGSDGVGVFRQSWVISFCASSGSTWEALGAAEVDVYVLAARPTAPWEERDPSLPPPWNMPWTDVLDHACVWAAGATTLEEVASKLTRAFFDDVAGGLPDPRFQYLADAPLYVTDPTSAVFDFKLEALLVDLVAVGVTTSINCSDGSSIVSVFAGILGCPVCRIRITPPGADTDFLIHDVQPMGWGRFDSVAASLTYHDTVHHSADLAPATIADLQIYELCFELDTDGDPEAPPHTAVLPRGMRYDTDYLDGFVIAPNLDWAGSTERACGQVKIVPAPTQVVSDLVANTVEVLSVEHSQPQWSRFAEGLRLVEEALSPTAAPVAFRSHDASLTMRDAGIRSLVIRFFGPLPDDPRLRPPRSTLWAAELFRVAGVEDAHHRFAGAAEASSEPGRVLVDEPGARTIVYGGGRSVLVLDDLLVVRWTRIGSRRNPAPVPSA